MWLSHAVQAPGRTKIGVKPTLGTWYYLQSTELLNFFFFRTVSSGRHRRQEWGVEVAFSAKNLEGHKASIPLRYDVSV